MCSWAVRGGRAREPALDGLRALAVAAVLLFHGGVSWMPAGYLGVSLFFTLSGFLITRLLLDELDATGTIALGSFYARRTRRLVPASLLCLLGVVLAARAGWFAGVAHLRRDLLAALGQVFNWAQLSSGGSYADLVSKDAGVKSPLDHFWSLAIEEQFYWLWPLILLLMARWARRFGHDLLGPIVGAAVLTALGAPLVAFAWGPDAAYWATPARAAEILAGAAAAALYHRGHLRRVPTWLAPAGLVGIGVLSVVLPTDHGFAYRGGLAVIGMISAVVLLALRRPSRTGRLLAARPLVAIGAVSYGLYLFHWPVYVLLDEARTGLDGIALLSTRLAVTTAITVGSYVALEQPVRSVSWRPARTMVTGLAAAAAAVLAISAVPAGVSDYWSPSAVQGGAIQPTATVAPLVSLPPTGRTIAEGSGSGGDGAVHASRADIRAPGESAAADPVLSRPARILVIGDSTAIANGNGLAAWAVEHPQTAQVSVLATPRCGMVRGGTIPSDGGDDSLVANCEQLVGSQLAAEVARLQPDVVAVFVVARDCEPRRWDETEGTLDPTDPRYVARVEQDYAALRNLVVKAAPAARVAWVRPPTINPWWKDADGAYANPAGHAMVDDVAARAATADPDHVAVVDLRTWVEAQGLDRDEAVRPDGIHFTPDAALQVAEQWLGAELVATATDPPARGTA